MLQEMTRKKKIGVLMSLHELDLAERVSDKIVCVKGENIEHYGTPEEVFADGFVDQLYDRRKWYGKFSVPAASEKRDSICSGDLRKK